MLLLWGSEQLRDVRTQPTVYCALFVPSLSLSLTQIPTYRCHETDRCCSSYEHCVSCCLKPQFNAQELMKTQFRIHHHPTTGKWDDAFQYCMGKCRTHKRSTVHENAFIDDRHFCFSDSSRPKVSNLHTTGSLAQCRSSHHERSVL